MEILRYNESQNQPDNVNIVVEGWELLVENGWLAYYAGTLYSVTNMFIVRCKQKSDEKPHKIK